MDCLEALVILRRHRRIRVDTPVGSAFAYVSNSPKPNLKPPRAYLEKLLRGYELCQHVSQDYLQALSETPTIERFIYRDPPNFLCSDYERFPRKLRGVVVAYDKLCLRFFARLIMKPSPIERWLPAHAAARDGYQFD